MPNTMNWPVVLRRAVLVFGISAVSLSAVSVQAQAAIPGTAPRTHSKVPVSAASTTSLPGAKLDMLVRLQAAARQSGDSAQIARTSRELNAELLALLANLEAAGGRADEASRLYRDSLQAKPDLDVQLRFALLLARSGQKEEAAAVARAATVSDPDNVRTWSTLGSVLRSNGDDRGAVDALTQALKLDSNVSIAFGLGSALLAIHDEARAAEIFQRILRASDGAAIWHVAIGDAYREASYLNEAAAQFRAALAIDPRALHAEFFLGLVNLQMNEWGPNSESFAHLRKSVEQNPREYLSNFYLGALESTDGSDLAASDQHLHAAAEANPTQPEVWIYLGQNANREHRPDEAISDFRKAIQLTGKDEARNAYQVRRAYFGLGRLLIAQGDRTQGEKYLADYKRTSALDAASASRSIATTQGAAAAATLRADAQSGDMPLGSLAADTTTKGLTQPASDADTATVSSVSPEMQSAESRLRTLLGTSYNDLGTAEARQQLYAEALQDFKQAQRFGNESPTVLHNTASAAFRVNDTAEAARALTAYFDTAPTPNDPRARLMLAMADFDLGHFGEAARAFAAAGDLTAADPRTLYSYALALARSGDAQQATALADRLSAMDLPPDRQMLVCNVYFTAENYEGSRACYARLTAAVPDLPRAHYFVGESLIRLVHPAEAIPELQSEQKLSPDEPNVTSALAFALSQTGHKDEALTMLQSTVATHPDAAEAQYQLGKLLAEQGRTAEAIPHLEAAVTNDPSKDYAHYQLATAYRKAGRTQDAEREFQTYRSIKDQRRNDRAIPQAAVAGHP